MNGISSTSFHLVDHPSFKDLSLDDLLLDVNHLENSPLEGNSQETLEEGVIQDLLDLYSLNSVESASQGETQVENGLDLNDNQSIMGLIENWVKEFETDTFRESLEEEGRTSFYKRGKMVEEVSSSSRGESLSWREEALQLMAQDLECREGHREVLGSLNFKNFKMSALQVMAYINRNGLNCAQRRRKQEERFSIFSSKDLPIEMQIQLLACAKQHPEAVDQLTSLIDPSYPQNLLNRKYDPYLYWRRCAERRKLLQLHVRDFDQTSPFAFDRLFPEKRWETYSGGGALWLEIVCQFLMINAS